MRKRDLFDFRAQLDDDAEHLLEKMEILLAATCAHCYAARREHWAEYVNGIDAFWETVKETDRLLDADHSGCPKLDDAQET